MVNFMDEVFGLFSATLIRSFTPNDEAIGFDRQFQVFPVHGGQFNLDDQMAIVAHVNVVIGNPPTLRIGWTGRDSIHFTSLRRAATYSSQRQQLVEARRE